LDTKKHIFQLFDVKYMNSFFISSSARTVDSNILRNFIFSRFFQRCARAPNQYTLLPKDLVRCAIQVRREIVEVSVDYPGDLEHIVVYQNICYRKIPLTENVTI